MRRSARVIAGVVVLAAAASPARAQCDPQRIPVDVRFDQQPVALSVHNGELVAGGSFTRIGGASFARIARWDGSAWAKYGAGLSGPVSTLGEFQGELIAGGSFQGGLAAWNGTGWRIVGGGVNASVYGVFTRGSELIVGGLFSSAGGKPANRVAAWNGTSWRTFGDGFDRSVWAFAVYNDELIAAGRFTASGSRPLNCIARWDGSQWQSLGPGLEGDVLALTVYNNELIAAGLFRSSAGRPMNCIARWDGADWRAMGEGLLSRPGWEYASYVSGLAVYRGDLYAGGVYDRSGEVPMDGIARWDGESWHALQGSMRNSRALTVFRHELISSESVSSTGGDGWARWSCPPCIADVDDDGLVDFTDYLAFLDMYRGGEPGADVTGDGVVDRSDWLLFLETYSTGCT
ncbi:MAG: hypothetical protein IT436_11580 [Phycisphaerales bacterium]|nr:hypothetical protein [Phycisphaerales bacterium]